MPLRTRPRAPDSVRLPAALEADVREGVEQADRAEAIELTPDELEQWTATGELPERVDE